MMDVPVAVGVGLGEDSGLVAGTDVGTAAGVGEVIVLAVGTSFGDVNFTPSITFSLK